MGTHSKQVVVEVNVGDLDNDQLVDEFIRRLENEEVYISVLDGRKLINLIRYEIGEPEMEIIPENLDEEIRLEHIAKIFNKYSTAEIEARLPL